MDDLTNYSKCLNQFILQERLLHYYEDMASARIALLQLCPKGGFVIDLVFHKTIVNMEFEKNIFINF